MILNADEPHYLPYKVCVYTFNFSKAFDNVDTATVSTYSTIQLNKITSIISFNWIVEYDIRKIKNHDGEFQLNCIHKIVRYANELFLLRQPEENVRIMAKALHRKAKRR